MNMKKVTSGFFVSEQIQPGDITRAAAQGIQTVICNRPDCEAADQPDTHDIVNAATDAGVEFVHIPVVAGSITEENVREFEAACKSANGTILAYCRSGMRSISLWALAAAETRPVDTILASARTAGYDLAGLKPNLALRARGSNKLE